MTDQVPAEAITAAWDGFRQLMEAEHPGWTSAIPPREEWLRLAVSAAAEAATPAIRAAERERLYAELGNDHYVIFTKDRFTVEHSVECKLSGHMHECDWHEAVRRIAVEFDPAMAGRWRIAGLDSEGLPILEGAHDRDGRE